jgi:hypothetical protein
MVVDVVLPALLLILFIDWAFIGASLRVLGVGTWYAGMQQGEKVVCRVMTSGWSGNWGWKGVYNVVVTDRRLLVRILFSRVAIADVPLEDVESVKPQASWWKGRTLTVVYRGRDRLRDVQFSVNRKTESRFVECLRNG